MENNFVITIGRQYGCGGRAIGKILSEKLGIEYYDSELITMAAEKNGVDTSFYEKVDENPQSTLTSIFSFGVPGTAYYMPLYDNIAVNDRLFITQSEIIKTIAAKPCVIVGRCADYILQGASNLVRVFLYADLETRKKHIIEKYGIPDDKTLIKTITKADKRRASYYNSYTDRQWGYSTNYDLCLNTSVLSLEDVAELIIDAARRMSK